MSIDQVMRAIGTIACLYTVALSISAMTIASLGAVGFANSTPCTARECVAQAKAQHRAAPDPYEAVFLAPMVMFSSEP
jgi:hypothetical protein